jgi:hypothetical protein
MEKTKFGGFGTTPRPAGLVVAEPPPPPRAKIDLDFFFFFIKGWGGSATPDWPISHPLVFLFFSIFFNFFLIFN